MATKDFINFTPDTGDNDATINVTASANSGAARSTTLEIKGEGITKQINISQALGSKTLHFNIQYIQNVENSREFIVLASESITHEIESAEVEVNGSLGIPYPILEKDLIVSSTLTNIVVEIGIIRALYENFNNLLFEINGFKNATSQIGKVTLGQGANDYFEFQFFQNTGDRSITTYTPYKLPMDMNGTAKFHVTLPQDFIDFEAGIEISVVIE